MMHRRRGSRASTSTSAAAAAAVAFTILVFTTATIVNADTCNAADNKECPTSSSSSSSLNSGIIKLRQGGCFDSEHGKANRINLGSSADAVACADKVIAANQECKCTPNFEFDSTTGFCGCGGVGGNECKGTGHSTSRTAAVYQFTGPSRSCPTVPEDVNEDVKEDVKEDGTLSQQRQSAAAVPVQGVRLKRTPSGMLYATTRGGAFEKIIELAASAVLGWAEAEGIAVKAKLQKKLAHMAITYIMTTSGEKRDTGMFLDLASTPEFDAITAIARVLPKRMTDYIDDKRSYGRLARQADVEGPDSAVPRTFESTADAIKVLGSDPAAGKYVFIKDVYGSGGLGISVRRTEDLKDVKLGPHQIIQEGVAKFALVEGRTLKIRVTVIVYRGKLYLSRQWSGFKGSSIYDPDSTGGVDLNGQHVSQHFFHNESKKEVSHDSPYAKEYWKKNGGRILFSDDAPLCKEWTASMVKAVKQMIPMFAKIIDATADDPYRYHVFGLDAIPREDHSVQIIEVNPFPNLSWSQTICTQNMVTVIRLLLGMEAEGPDDLIALMA